ncbi:MAG: AAA family ATPase, partial [Anaerolineae bacterium]
MLTHLLIENFAIIDRAELAFDPGFNVLTGDTGAGKSIIVDAVSRLLGGRADSEDIRAGAEEALIEGVFALTGPEATGVRRILTEHGLADTDADPAILSRQIVREGRNLARINGRVVTLGLLRDVGQKLVDIHNQGQHLSLLRVSEHVGFLDRFAELVAEGSEVSDRVQRLDELRREMANLVTDERELARRVDRLRF